VQRRFMICQNPSTTAFSRFPRQCVALGTTFPERKDSSGVARGHGAHRKAEKGGSSRSKRKGKEGLIQIVKEGDLGLITGR
jgi:hypothetical protein